MDKLQADQEQLQKKVKALEAELARRANAAAMAQRQLNQVENELVKLQAEVERKEELEAHSVAPPPEILAAQEVAKEVN